MRMFIILLRKIANKLEQIHSQYICKHNYLRYIQDAWDYEYICPNCDKRWINKTPKFNYKITVLKSKWRT